MRTITTDSPILISRFLYSATAHQIHEYDVSDTKGPHESSRSFWSVPGVGIVRVRYAEDWNVSYTKRVEVTVVWGRFEANAVLHGTGDHEKQDLIVAAARAALAEAKRTNRKKRKRAAKGGVS